MPLRVPRRWKLRPHEAEVVDRLVAEAEVGPWVARLLAARNITDPGAAVQFLEPSLEDLHDPFLIPHMRAACDAVHSAIAAGEIFTLYGDYDVDGTCATAVLWWAFKKLKAKVRYHVPDRRDGYGLTRVGLEATAAAGSKFVVTMDQGISAVDEIEYARSLGIRVLVTDHHSPPPKLPEAVAILHPSLYEGYPNPHLCGAAMAFKFGQALLASAPNEALRASAPAYVETCIDLAALATIADVSPLVGENRAIVALGLGQLGRTRHPGLAAMLAESGRKRGTPKTSDVAFGIAPMMNAAGRLAGPDLTLDCLLARKRPDAKRAAKELQNLNKKRRELTEELMELALEQHSAWSDEKIGVIRLDSDQVGIVGLVAGRLREMFWKPFVVLAAKGEGELVGSCRSVDDFSVKVALDAVGDKLLKYGGHAQAAGLSVVPEQFEAMAEGLRLYAQDALDEDLLVPRLPVDEELNVEDLTWDLLEEVERLAPFGAANPAPVFVLKGCEVEKVKVMGKGGKHVRIQGRGFPEFLDPVGFHLRGATDRSMLGTDAIDMAFQVGADEWLGRRRIQMRLEDVRAAK